jgi:hypothetical protein
VWELWTNLDPGYRYGNYAEFCKVRLSFSPGISCFSSVSHFFVSFPPPVSLSVIFVYFSCCHPLTSSRAGACSGSLPPRAVSIDPARLARAYQPLLGGGRGSKAHKRVAEGDQVAVVAYRLPSPAVFIVLAILHSRCLFFASRPLPLVALSLTCLLSHSRPSHFFP